MKSVKEQLRNWLGWMTALLLIFLLFSADGIKVSASEQSDILKGLIPCAGAYDAQENYLGIIVMQNPCVYFVSVDDIAALPLNAREQGNSIGTGGDQGSGSTGSGSAGNPNDGAAEATVLGENGIWGYSILAVAVLLGVLMYGYVKKNKNSGEKQNCAEEISFDSSAEPSILGVGGVHDGALIPLSETLIFGRDQNRCNLVFPDDSKGISSVHCQICILNGRVELTDLGSTFGTFLSNGTKLVPHVPYCLNRGESFYLADRQYSYRVQ